MCWKFKVGSWFGLGEYWVSEATSAPGIQYCWVGQKISSDSYGERIGPFLCHDHLSSHVDMCLVWEAFSSKVIALTGINH